MAESKSRFTVAKLDAGVAILLTSDHHLIEFPSLLLPSNITAGSIIDLAVAQNANEEEEERKQFEKLQNEIRQMFGEHAPSTPKLSVRNTTQTSVVLAWDLLDLATADMRSMSLYKNGSKLGKIPNATTTTTKLSGLALDTEYTFQLVLKTSAGTQKSNPLQVKTHKMTNLSGLNVCVGHIRDVDRASLEEALRRIGAKPPHDKVRIDTTHFVTDRGMGEEFIKAQHLNIPVVVPDFVEACEREGRLVRVGDWYLDSDPSKRQRRTTAASVQSSTAATTAGSTMTKDTTATEPDSNSTRTVTATVVESVQGAAEQVKEAATEVGQSLSQGVTQLAQAVGLKSETEQEKETGEQAPSGETKETVEEVLLSPAEAAPAAEKEVTTDEKAFSPAEAAPAEEEPTTGSAERAKTPPIATKQEKGKGKALEADTFPPSMRPSAPDEDEFESVSLS